MAQTDLLIPARTGAQRLEPLQQRLYHILGVARSCGRVSRQEPVDGLGDAGGAVRRELCYRRRVGTQTRIQGGARGEGTSPHQRLEGGRPQRVELSGERGGGARDSLGSQVRDGPTHLAEGRGGAVSRQAEVDEAEIGLIAVSDDERVLRFHVSVDHALSVDTRERLSETREQPQTIGYGERRARLVEWAPVDEGAHDVGSTRFCREPFSPAEPTAIERRVEVWMMQTKENAQRVASDLARAGREDLRDDGRAREERVVHEIDAALCAFAEDAGDVKTGGGSVEFRLWLHRGSAPIEHGGDTGWFIMTHSDTQKPQQARPVDTSDMSSAPYAASDMRGMGPPRDVLSAVGGAADRFWPNSARLENRHRSEKVFPYWSPSRACGRARVARSGFLGFRVISGYVAGRPGRRDAARRDAAARAAGRKLETPSEPSSAIFSVRRLTSSRLSAIV